MVAFEERHVMNSLTLDNVLYETRGAIAYVTAGKIRQRQDVISGGSYASQNDMTLHFGLGAATSVDKVEIKWPDGTVESVNVQGVDRKLTVIEGKGIAK